MTQVGRAVAVATPLVVVALLRLTGLWQGESWRAHHDLDVYLVGARQFLDQGSPYEFLTARGLGFTYPPIALLVFLPLLLVSAAVAWWLWSVLIITFGCAATRRVLAGSPATSLAGCAAVSSLVAVTDSFSDSLLLGQISPLVGALAFLGVAGGARGAVWVGVASAIKLTPSVNLVALGLRPDPKARIARMIVAAVLATATGVVLSPSASREYWTHALFDTTRVGSISSPSNVSLPGLFAHAGLPSVAALILGIATSALVLAAGFVLARRRKVDGLVPAVLGGTMSVLASPIAWSHHAVAVSLGLGVLALRRSWMLAIVGALIWTLPVFDWAGHITGVAAFGLQSLRPLSAVLLLVLLLQNPQPSES